MTKRKVPIKNVEPVMVDIKKPGITYIRPVRFEKINLSRIAQAPKNRSRKKVKSIFWISAAFVSIFFLLGLFSIFINFKNAKLTLLESGEKIAGNFSDSVYALKELRPGDAAKALKENDKELSSLNEFLNKNKGQTLLSALGKVIPAFKDAGNLLGQVTKLNFNFLGISSVLADLQMNGFKYFQTDGESLIKSIETTDNLIGKVINDAESVKNSTTNLKKVSSVFDRFDDVIGDQYISYSADLHGIQKFLKGLLNLFSSGGTKNIVLFFQNPAEIRPGGGFIGSYAHLVINRGQMTQMDVRDIYDPDGQLSSKIIPPEPLQTLTQNWGARDANWFFDFPTSAKTVLGFLESSKIYEEQGIKFEGAIALNINVLESILDIVGPIPLPEYKLTINRDNFLNEIQREVEAGKDKKAGEPKRILKILTPIILEKMNNLSETEKQTFMEKLKEHISLKDIMFYANDPELAAFFRNSTVDGSIYPLPNSFWGSYLGVVNANIAGGKSDAFMVQEIEARIDLDTDGGNFTDLALKRTHEGAKEKDSWWRATNKNYLQIFTEPGTALASLKGASPKPAASGISYSGNYSKNPDLETIESTKTALNGFPAWSFNAFGKNIFGMWLNTAAGKTSTLNMRYQSSGNDKISVGEGSIYKFIFDRQSGVKSKLKVVINAPLGYNWSENGSPVYIFETENPKAREILNLTLNKTDD